MTGDIIQRTDKLIAICGPFLNFDELYIYTRANLFIDGANLLARVKVSSDQTIGGEEGGAYQGFNFTTSLGCYMDGSQW